MRSLGTLLTFVVGVCGVVACSDGPSNPVPPDCNNAGGAAPAPVSSDTPTTDDQGQTSPPACTSSSANTPDSGPTDTFDAGSPGSPNQNCSPARTVCLFASECCSSSCNVATHACD